MSFVATANAVSHASAVAHFVDVAVDTWGIDPDILRQHLGSIGEARGEVLYNKHTGRPITALVPMHALGHPADIAELLAVATEFNLVVVEDAAESLGSMVGDRHTGLFGRLGVFSFNGNKIITTGGGGVIVTDDDELALRVRHLSTTARVPHRYEFDHDEVGYNYRMPNINAALGLAQMEQLPALVAQQRQVFDKYLKAFSDWPFGQIHREREGTTSNYWLQAFTLSADVANEKNSLIANCVDSGIGVRPLWKPLNRLEPYGSCPSAKTPVTEDLYNRVICLPSSASLSAPDR
jgi:perosamine synthetase